MILTIRQSGSEDKVLELADGATLMESLAAAGLGLDAPCGGRGRCGKCLVRAEGDLDPPEALELASLGSKPGRRLACQAKGRGKVAISLDSESVFSSLKGLGWTAPYSFDPMATLMDVPERGRRDPKPVLEALSLKPALGPAMALLAELEAARAPFRVLFSEGRLLNAWPKRGGPRENLGAAFDLGTTGLAVAIVDLGKREAVAVEAGLNPQTLFGADVISRISYACEKPENLAKLQDCVLAAFSRLLGKALGRKSAKGVGVAVVSGNAAMLHLLAGVNPKSLAKAPYRPIFTDWLSLSPLAPRLGLPSWAEVAAAPSISAFVGGDAVCGMTAIKLRERPGTVMFIDIGTNGEIALSRNGRLAAASCAAGPAFEGMGIACGMRAVEGAVDSFLLVPGLSHVFSTIGGAEPKGICGSGLIDLVAELVTSGLIQKSGRMAPELEESGEPAGSGKYHLTDSVYLSQKDVRQVQLAKGAISAAMRTLLAKLGLSVSDLDEVVIAGSFGYHLRAESLLAIGLVPKDYRGPITFVGNSSLAGAARILMDRSAMAEIERLKSDVEVIELGFETKFQDAFISDLSF